MPVTEGEGMLITGAARFIGSHRVEELPSRGHEIIGFV